MVHNVVQRIGWFPVEQKQNPIAEKWLEGLPDQFGVFCWHDRAFSIPSGATSILGSEWCVNEGFVFNNTLALQGHLELTADMVHNWVEYYADQVYYPSNEVHCNDNLVVNWESVIQGPDMITLNLPRRLAELNQAAKVVYGHWLRSVLKQEQLASQ